MTRKNCRAILAVKINKLIERRNLSQAEAAGILGMPPPKISSIRNYKLQGISLERLMHALTALGQYVEIVVRPSTRRVPPSVAAHVLKTVHTQYKGPFAFTGALKEVVFLVS